MRWLRTRLDLAIDSAEFINCDTPEAAHSLRRAIRRRLAQRGIGPEISTSIRGTTVWLTRNQKIILSTELL